MAKLPRVPVPRSVERRLDAVLDKALAVEGPVVAAYVDRMRRRRPLATPAELVDQMERHYLTTVVGAGAAAGGAAALPGVGTGASIASGIAEITAFVTATATFVLARAEVHGIALHDAQVRRALVLTVLLGDVGAAALAGAEIDAAHWAEILGRSGSKESVRLINARLGQLFVTRFGTRQGALLVGRALPFGVGAGVGAAGNLALGRSAVNTARRIFGSPPPDFGQRIIEA